MKISSILSDFLYDSYVERILFVNQKEQQTLIDKDKVVFFRALIENDEEFFLFRDENNNYWLSPNHKKISINNVCYEISNIKIPIQVDVFKITPTSQQQILTLAIKYFSDFLLPTHFNEASTASIFNIEKPENNFKHDIFKISEINYN